MARTAEDAAEGVTRDGEMCFLAPDKWGGTSRGVEVDDSNAAVS